MSAADKMPVVGLFLDSFTVKNLRDQISSRYLRLNKMAEASEQAGVKLVAFSVDDVFFFPEGMQGFGFDKDLRRWVKVNTALPDVLYDRFVGLPFQNKRADYIRYEMSRRGVKKINSRHFFDKFELVQVLSGFDAISPCLPLTWRLLDTGDLSRIFQKRKNLYVKAAVGARGRQVIRVSRLPAGGYSYSYYTGRLYSGKVRDLNNLMEIIKKVCGGGRVIAQEAVDVLMVDNRVVDLRSELQRNGKGELEVVAIMARIGSKDSPIATHGTSFMLEQFIPTYLRRSRAAAAHMKERIESFLMYVYRSIEQVYGPFGEIGIDCGMDRRGKLWIFECNAKSMRVSLCNSAGSAIINRAFQNPFLYAKYLCNQSG